MEINCRVANDRFIELIKVKKKFFSLRLWIGVSLQNFNEIIQIRRNAVNYPFGFCSKWKRWKKNHLRRSISCANIWTFRIVLKISNVNRSRIFVVWILLNVNLMKAKQPLSLLSFLAIRRQWFGCTRFDCSIEIVNCFSFHVQAFWCGTDEFYRKYFIYRKREQCEFFWQTKPAYTAPRHISDQF